MHNTTVLIDAVTDTVAALRALPGAVLQTLPSAPQPVRRVLRSGRCASVVAQRAAWYSALAALVLLTPSALAQADATPQPPSSKDSADSSTVHQPSRMSASAGDPAAGQRSASEPPAWAAALLVLAVVSAQAAQRRVRGAFTA